MRLRAARPFAALSVALAVAAAAGAASQPACRARVSLDPPQAVVGQQVLYQVRIVSRDDVESVEWSAPPSFASLRSEVLPGDPQPSLAAPAPGFRVRDERRALFAETPGTHRLAAPPLRCVTRGGALESAEVPVARLTVTPAPEAGRPAEWSGLVGPVSVHVTVTPREIRLGESVRVAVMLRGENNLWAVPAPYRAEAFPGSELFEQRPKLVLDRGRRLSLRRHFAWDVVPRSEGTLRVPALALPWLDPRSGRYGLTRSEAVEVRVGPRPAAGAGDAGRTRSAPLARRPAGGGFVWAALALLAALAVIAGGWLRRRSAAVRAGAGRHGGAAAAPGAGGADEAARLERSLRAALARHVPDVASLTPEELIARDPQDAAVAAAAHLLAALERARFDPRSPPPDAVAVRRAIEAL